MAKQILAGLLALAACACSNGHAAGTPAQHTRIEARPGTRERTAEGASPALTTQQVGSATAAIKYVFSGAGSTLEAVAGKAPETHTAAFRGFQGAIELVEGDLQKSLVIATVDTASLTADDPALSARLKSAALLDVATYPDASFRSTAIVLGGVSGATHTVTGRLRLHGVTRPISFPASLKVSPTTLQADGEFAIDPAAFGIVWPDSAGYPSASQVRIKLSIRGANMPR